MANELVTRLLLNNKQFDNNLTQSTKQVQQFQRNVSDVSRGIQAGFGKIPSIINPLSDSFSMLALKVGTATTALAGLGSLVKQNVQYNKELDNSLSALKAITGGSAEEMDRYREAAIQLGRTTPQTAAQVGEAFKIVAQMKPELAQVQSALVDVTEASLNLANAQGTDVATAADIVTRALNVYNASARQAERFTNVLAAGCRNGSGDIEWLGNAFGKAGAAAVAVNMSYEETITTLELMSRRIKDSTSAGAQLRNILIYLEKTNDDQLRPSVVGVSKALQNLRDRHYDLIELQNIFKKQNIEGINTLIDYAGEFDELKSKITDTNAAYEMAETRQDNLTGAINRLDSAWQSFILDLGNSNGIIMKITDSIANFLNRLAGVTETSTNNIKGAKRNTDRVLYDVALQMANDGASKEDIKKELAKKVAERRKWLEEEIKKQEEIYKKNYNYNNNNPNSAKQQAASNAAMMLGQYKAQLKVLDEIPERYGMIADDALSEVKRKLDAEHYDEVISVDFDLETASIDELNERVKELKKLRDASNDTAAIVKYNAQIQEAKNRIDQLTGKQSNYNAELRRTQQELERINKLSSNFDNLVADIKVFSYNDNNFNNLSDDLVDELKKLPKEIKAQLEPNLNKFINKQNYLAEQYRLGNITTEQFKSESSKLQGDLLNNLVEFATSGDILQYNKKALNESRLPTGLNRIINILSTQQGQNKTDANNAVEARKRYEDIKKRHESLQKPTASLTSTTETDVIGNVYNKSYAELEGQATAIKSVIHELKAIRKEYSSIIQSNLISEEDDISYLLNGLLNCNDSIQILENSFDKVKDKLKEMKKLADTSDVADSIASMGNSIAGVFRAAGEEEAAFFMQSLSQIAELIAQLANMAIVAGVTSAAKLPFPYNIAAIATSVATIGGIVASAMQTFANGGIVDGNSYVGDRKTVRVNSGEMILNKHQQANLFNMINEGRTPTSEGINGNVVFRISGKELVGVLDNYNNKRGKLL